MYIMKYEPYLSLIFPQVLHTHQLQVFGFKITQ